MNDKKVQFIYDFIDTILSLVRFFLLTRLKKIQKIKREHNSCIIMGNGPSLLKALNDNQDKLSKCDLVAVNHLAQTPEYTIYKPNVYILCDPAFWFAKNYEVPGQVAKETYDIIVKKTTWPLQIYLPYQAKRANIKDILATNKNIQVYFYNKTKFDGYKWLRYKIFSKQWGMVRAQTVLNAALMLTIYSDYKEVILMGADTDWMKDIWVDEQNRVRIHDTHFYFEKTRDKDRILPVRMSEQSAAFYYTFKSYEDIADYACYRKVKIYNKNPHSFIDAFEK